MDCYSIVVLELSFCFHRHHHHRHCHRHRHGCMKCCEGCELRRCCLPRSPSRHPWPRLKPHLCEHCLTLYDEYVSKLPGSGNEIPLQHIRFQVARILYAHARRMKRDSELSEGTFSTLPDENSSDGGDNRADSRGMVAWRQTGCIPIACPTAPSVAVWSRCRLVYSCPRHRYVG